MVGPARLKAGSPEANTLLPIRLKITTPGAAARTFIFSSGPQIKHMTEMKIGPTVHCPPDLMDSPVVTIDGQRNDFARPEPHIIEISPPPPVDDERVISRLLQFSTPALKIEYVARKEIMLKKHALLLLVPSICITLTASVLWIFGKSSLTCTEGTPIPPWAACFACVIDAALWGLRFLPRHAMARDMGRIFHKVNTVIVFLAIIKWMSSSLFESREHSDADCGLNASWLPMILFYLHALFAHSRCLPPWLAAR